MMPGIVEQFAANEVLPTILLMGVAAVLAWRDLGYVRHIRRIAEIEQRLALRNGNLASSSARHPSRVRHPHQRRHCRASGPGGERSALQRRRERACRLAVGPA
jgi:hypothetical protein